MNNDESSVIITNAVKLSWSAIVAGVFIALAVFVTLMFLGASLGLAVMNFEGGVSLSVSSWFSGLWLLLSFALALAIASYSTAKISNLPTTMSAILNGVTVWSVVSLSLFLVASKGAGEMLSKTGEAVSQVKDIPQSSMASAVGSALPDIDLKELQNMYKEIDAPEMKQSLEQELSKLKQQAQAAVKDTIIQPDRMEENFHQLRESTKESLDSLRQEYDQEKIADVISRNTDLSEREAQVAAQRWEKKLEDVEYIVENSFQKVEEEVTEVANETKNVAAASSFLVFLFFGVGLIVSIFSSTMALRVKE